jgi:NADPH2:quinone reductase
VPDNVDLAAAGGVPEAFVTAHDAMVTQARLQPGETVLVHAIGSGVGTAALQFAKAYGCRVVGTSRTVDKLERAAELGLDVPILAPADCDPAALAAAIRAAAGPVDVVLDLVGGNYVEADVAAVGMLGRIVLVSVSAGGQSTLAIFTVMQKRLQIFDTMLRPRSVVEKAAATAAFVADVVPHFASGAIRPIVEDFIPLADAGPAYDRLGTGSVFGKLVLVP